MQSMSALPISPSRLARCPNSTARIPSSSLCTRVCWQRAASVGIYPGIHCGEPAYAARMIRMGFRPTTIANDSGLMAKAAREASQALEEKSASSGKPRSPGGPRRGAPRFGAPRPVTFGNRNSAFARDGLQKAGPSVSLKHCRRSGSISRMCRSARPDGAPAAHRSHPARQGVDSRGAPPAGTGHHQPSVPA